MNRHVFILSTLVLAFAVSAAAIWYTSRPAPIAAIEAVSPQLAEALVRPYSPVLGPEEAPVTVVEFFDPACEACRAFHPIVKDIMDEHGDAVRVVIRYTPFHGEASEQGIRILEAARMQGVYEPVLEAILREQPRWAPHGAQEESLALLLLAIGSNAGLDLDAARSQMLMPDLVGIMNQDLADVEALGIRQTPTFFVNGKKVEPFGEDQLRAMIAEEVAVAAQDLEPQTNVSIGQ